MPSQTVATCCATCSRPEWYVMRKCLVWIVYQRSDGSLAACAGPGCAPTTKAIVTSVASASQSRRSRRIPTCSARGEHRSACVVRRHADGLLVVRRDDARGRCALIDLGDEAL